VGSRQEYAARSARCAASAGAGTAPAVAHGGAGGAENVDAASVLGVADEEREAAGSEDESADEGCGRPVVPAGEVGAERETTGVVSAAGVGT
jgi:hypothetical protein